MNLFSAGKKQNFRSVYGYLIAGGLGSLLMLFLIQKSLPFNRQQARQYHQDLLTVKQKIYALEKDLLAMQSYSLEFDNILKSHIEAIDSALDPLQETPQFISQSEQKSLKDRLEAQSAALALQFDTIARLQDAHSIFVRSCEKISILKSESLENPQTLGNNINTNSSLFVTVNNLLDVSLQYCRNPTDELKTNIQQYLAEINTLLNRDYTDKKFIVTEFASYSQEIINKSNIINYLKQEIDFTDIIDRLQAIESDYLELYYSELRTINNYRLVAFTSLLLIVIFVAYKINSNLAKTNRNIVKILEGFTKELETKVEERTAQLEDSIQNTEAALTQAQNANKAKSRFLANMSHELRTPLNAILGFTQLMTRDSSIGAEQQENLKIINRSGEHLLRLINDILEMSKIEVGQITLNETQFDLHLMLKSIEEMLRLKANSKNIKLSFHIARDVPRIIYTDEGKLRQIIINLLGNALKFTEKGAVTLTVKINENSHSAEDKIDFLFSDTYALNFSVADTGPGIEPEEMKGLFTPFEQTKIGRVSNEGTGLGLSICHKFVDLMGGELKAESTPGKGSNFYFDILIRVQDVSAIAAADLSTAEDRKIVGLALDREYRILAVDDVPASRLLLRQLLTEVGFLVEEAGDGGEAIAKWQQWHPDLILMDMRMPEIDGYEATTRIKAEPEGKDTVIIALTASAFEEERVVILSAGCDDFMRKPFKEGELLEKIGQYLSIEYIYEDTPTASVAKSVGEITPESLTVMPNEWRSQLYDAAAKVDNQEIFELLAEIPDEYESLAKGLADLAEQFRCDKIIDLAKSAD